MGPARAPAPGGRAGARAGVPRHVEEAEPEEDGEDPLPGEHEHGHPGQHEDPPEEVPPGAEEEPQGRMAGRAPARPAAIRQVVVRRQPDHDPRHEEEPGEEGRGGDPTQPGEPSLVRLSRRAHRRPRAASRPSGVTAPRGVPTHRIRPGPPDGWGMRGGRVPLEGGCGRRRRAPPPAACRRCRPGSEVPLWVRSTAIGQKYRYWSEVNGKRIQSIDGPGSRAPGRRAGRT